MAGEYIVKAATKGELLIPRTLHNGGDNPVLCLINISDHYVEVEKGEVLAYAEEVCSNVETIGVQKVEVAEQGGLENGKREIPEHLINLFDKSKGELDEQEQTQLSELLCEFEDVFAKSEFDLGKFNTIQHGIDTGTNRPVKQRIRRTPLGFAGEEEAQLKKMLSAGVIRPSVSEWASAPVLIRKRCGSVRWCVDYRALNALTIKDVFPLPLVDECLDTLAGNVWYSKLDANSAYWQMKIKPEDCSKTAFITKYGLFEFARMAFGLCNSPATYARVINLVLRGLNWKVVLAFLDDILVLGKDFEGHLANLRAVLVRFREYGLKLKPKKCELFQKEVEFLGRVVGPRGIYIGPGYIKDIKNWPRPKNKKEVERFLGFTNYHRAFIEEYTQMAFPLQALTGKRTYQWGDEQEKAFDELRNAMVRAPVLALPNATDPFILDTDASDKSVGAELIQIQEGEERAVAYGSLTLTPEQQKYCTTRKELLAIIRFSRQFRHYLLGRHFTVRTDHNSLTWLMNFKEPQGQLARWLEELSQFNMEIQHRPGKKHANADALSRIPGGEPCSDFNLRVKLQDLPCGGCPYCTRAHTNWSGFDQDVDDVVPLANRPWGQPVRKGQNPEEEEMGPRVAEIWVSTGEAGNRLRWESIKGVQIVREAEGISFQGPGEDEMKEEQRVDPELTWVVRWRETGEEPTEGELLLESPKNNSPSVGSSPVSLHLTTQANSGSIRCCFFISSSPGP